MYWHYRVRKRTDKGQDWFDIVEYYDNPRGWTRDGLTPGGETKEELIRELEMMLADAKKYRMLVDKEKP